MTSSGSSPATSSRPSLNDGPDQYAAGWRWCATNQRLLQETRPLERQTTCPGCGLPCPPPEPNPYERNPHAD
jgi:hypothetical protein